MTFIQFDNMNQELINSPKLSKPLPCQSCNGDCCGEVPFKQDELLDIFNKNFKRKEFRKRFPWNENDFKKNMVFRHAFPNSEGIIIPSFKKSSYYKKLGLSKGDCVFKKSPETGGCLIYEDRPTVCRYYGERELLRCPYEGLKEQPKLPEVKKKLIAKGFEDRNTALINQASNFIKI